MILIADSGSSKTTWCIINDTGIVEKFQTAGINPYMQTEKEIIQTLESEFLPCRGPFDHIYYYGAGCSNREKKEKVKKSLGAFFEAINIFAETDLLAAARSLCGRNKGIVAILGTGSNSCYYDGSEIVKHVSPLGYILGDEGSGSYLGKKLLSDVLKKQLPEDICADFFNNYNYKPDDILEQVYSKPLPNRFMANFTYFLGANINKPAIHKLVKDGFTDFFKRNIMQYPEAAELPVNFTGSIGWHFREILIEAASETCFRTGKITKDPVEGLLMYHKSCNPV